MNFSCVLIGEGALAARCLDILVERGTTVTAVVAADTVLTDAAKQAGILVHHASVDLLHALSSTSFDVLFSVVWRTVLSKETLLLPKRLAINYHNSPLPRFAGTHATAWALLEGIDEYAVTWHEMSERVNFGDILEQCSVPITSDDTVQSLEYKCLDAAIESFQVLINSLERDALTRRTQTETDRTWNSQLRRPFANGLINWCSPARNIDALCRATQFGPSRDNDFAAAKIYTDNGFLLVGLHHFREGTNHAPGTIIEVGSDRIRIAAIDGSIEITRLENLDGTPVSIDALTSTLDWAPGMHMPKVTDLIDPIELAGRKFGPKEHEWHMELLTLELLALPIPLPAQNVLSSPDWQSLRIDSALISESIKDRVNNTDEWLAAAFLLFLARAAQQSRFHIAFRHPDLASDVTGLENLYAGHVPLAVELTPGADCTNALRAIVNTMATVRTRGTFLNDLVARIPSCQPLDEILPVGITTAGLGAFTPGVLHLSTNPAKSPAFLFDSNRISRSLVRSVSNAFTTFIGELIRIRNQPWDTLDLVSPEQRQQILHNWNDTRDPTIPVKCVHQLIEKQVTQTPEQVAVVCGDFALSYEELNQRANGLAKQLITREVSRGDRIAVMLEGGINLPVAYLAIMKAGATFTPLDPDWPVSRVNALLEELDTPLVLSDEARIAKGTSINRPILSVDNKNLAPCTNLNLTTDPKEAMYVIFTSGSTGKPKGVINSHLGAVNRFYAGNKTWQKQTGNKPLRVLVTSPPSFDPSVRQYLWPLTQGGCSVIPTPGKPLDIDQLITTVDLHGVTSMSLVASLLKLLTEVLSVNPERTSLLSSLTHLLVGGERVEAPIVQEFLSLCPWVRVEIIYGPTETAIGVISHPVDPAESEPLPIGRPLPNVRAYILDNRLEPLPPGIVGELCIGGVQVGLGYLNDPIATASVFLNNPHVANEKLYRTGDRAWFRENGQIMFAGRKDDQVKIHGVRVELGEIQAALQSHAAIRECAVIIDGETTARHQLIAFAVAATGRKLDAKELIEYLRNRLPKAYLPVRIVVLQSIPKLTSGKVDRRLLLKSLKVKTTSPKSSVRDPIQETLKKLWLDASGLEQVHCNVNLFDAGADSLVVMRLINRIRTAFDIELGIADVFEYTSIEALSTLVRSRQ